MKLIPLEGKENHSLARHPATGIIYVKKFRTDKGQLEKSTKTDNAREARRVRDDLIQQWLGLQPKKQVLKVMSELWPEYVATKTDKSQGTRDSLMYSGKHLVKFFGNHLPFEITPQLWEIYIVHKREENPDRRFFNEWKWFNMFLGFLRDHGHIDRKPKIRNPDPTDEEAGKVYSDAEIKKLLANATGDLKLQFLMAYTMGMRKGEILNMGWERIDLNEEIIHLRVCDTKIRKSRTIGISAEVLPVLKARAKELKKKVSYKILKPKDLETPLFPSPIDETKKMSRSGNKRSWKTLKRNAGVDGRFHDLRHTFLTNAFKNAKGQIDSALICDYAGLSQEMAQRIYLHFNADDTRGVTKLVRLKK